MNPEDYDSPPPKNAEKPYHPYWAEGSTTPPFDTLVRMATSMSSPQEIPEQTAARAIALWKACEMAIIQIDESEEIRSILDAVTEEAEQNLRERIPLSEYLKTLMPESKAPDRMRKWRDFLSSLYCDTGKDIGAMIEKMREQGIGVIDARNGAMPFDIYFSQERTRIFSERGRKGKQAQVKKKLGAKKKVPKKE